MQVRMEEGPRRFKRSRQSCGMAWKDACQSITPEMTAASLTRQPAELYQANGRFG